MNGRFLTLAGMLLAAGALSAGEVIFEDRFENGLSKWRQLEKTPVGRLSEVGHRGNALEFDLAADPTVRNSNKWLGAYESQLFPASKGNYRLTGKIQFPKNFGIGVHVRFYDREKRRIGYMGTHYGSKPASATDWLDIDITGSAYRDEVAFASVGFNFPAWFDMTVRVDDIKLAYEEPKPTPPLWKPEYKIAATDRARLTAADFPGPDGVVYPDFSRAGVQEKFQQQRPTQTVKITPESGDLHAAVMRAIASLGPAGGVVELAPGDYRLARFLYITRDNVILKGAGKDRTRIFFDYDVPAEGVDLYGVDANTVIGPKSSLLVIAKPEGLQQLRLLVDGKEIRKVVRSMHSGNDSFLVGSMEKFKGAVRDGKLTLRAEATYSGNKVATREIAVRFDPRSTWTAPSERPAGAIMIQGGGRKYRPLLLANGAARGATEIRLQRADHGLKAGDAVVINAPATAEWKKLTRNACTWGTWRNYIVFIREVQGDKLLLDQPLRLEFPLDSKPFVDKIDLVQGCGVEDFYVENKTNFWVDSVHFNKAANSHASGLKVYKTGRNPVYGRDMKYCTIRDCEMDDAWFKGGGGTAYVGFECSYDNLMDNVVTRNMRHAPCVQWSAAGNVVRNSVFHGSDAQWHSGWSNENLYENCTVISDTKANGGYGYGVWASAPEDGSHGPNGPRNVVYNCDVVAEKTTIWLGGMNENWIFVGNRFRAMREAGFFAKDHSFDHILRNNVFVLEDRRSPAVILASTDCGGVEFVDNTIYGGNGKTVTGLREPVKQSGNRFLPLNVNAPRPTLAVPSIYEWQKNHPK